MTHKHREPACIVIDYGRAKGLQPLSVFRFQVLVAGNPTQTTRTVIARHYGDAEAYLRRTLPNDSRIYLGKGLGPISPTKTYRSAVCDPYGHSKVLEGEERDARYRADRLGRMRANTARHRARLNPTIQSQRPDHGNQPPSDTLASSAE